MLSLVAALLVFPSAGGAQVQVGVRAGAIVSSNLLTDSIVEPLRIRQNLAGFLGVTVDTRLDQRYRVGVAVQVSRSDAVLRSPGEESVITSLTVWHPSVTLRQSFGRAEVEASLGVLVYNPSIEVGTIFSGGAPAEPVVGLGVSLTQPVGMITAGLELRYDVHRFSTATLRNAGFSGETTVHRVAIGISIVRRGHDPAAP